MVCTMLEGPVNAIESRACSELQTPSSSTLSKSRRYNEVDISTTKVNERAGLWILTMILGIFNKSF